MIEELIEIEKYGKSLSEYLRSKFRQCASRNSDKRHITYT
jgi:hypothetical protein